MSLANGPALWGLLQQFISCGGGPNCPRIWLPSSMWNIMASTKDNYFDHFAMCKPGEFKRCWSGSGPKPAVLTPAAQGPPWPRTSHPLSFSALHRSIPDAGAKIHAFAESKKVEKSPSAKIRAGTKCVCTFVFSSKSCKLKLSTHISILCCLHSINVKVGNATCCASILIISCSED